MAGDVPSLLVTLTAPSCPHAARGDCALSSREEGPFCGEAASSTSSLSLGGSSSSGASKPGRSAALSDSGE